MKYLYDEDYLLQGDLKIWLVVVFIFGFCLGMSLVFLGQAIAGFLA